MDEKSENRNDPTVWRSEDRRLLYNIGWPQYNPEVLHGQLGSHVCVLVGVVGPFSDGGCAFRQTMLCGVKPSDRGLSWAVEHREELWGESARPISLDSSL